VYRGKNKEQIMGEKARAVWAVLRVPVSFAALRMQKQATADDSQNKQRQEQTTARTEADPLRG
jgi:hypothetical protein